MKIPRFVLVVSIVAALAAAGSDADALDRRLAGAKLVLKRSVSGREQLTFQAKDPAFRFPALGGADDPSQVGMRVELLANGVTVTFEVPAGVGKPGWSVKDANLESYRFSNAQAPDAFSALKTAFLKDTKALQLKGGSVGLPLSGSQAPVAIRITTGSDRNCALFDGASIVTDVPGKFAGKNSSASPGAQCGAQSLGFATCGNGVTELDEACDGGDDAACPGLCTACACPPPTCGDGVVNQGSEACDGTDDAACPGSCQPNCVCLGVCGDGIVNAPSEECDGATGCADPGTGFDCRAPADPSECTCCSPSGAFCADIGCCSPNHTCIPGPHFSGSCLAVSCEPPRYCEGNTVCGPFNVCCLPLGSSCSPGVAFPPCCAGSCVGPSGSATCCLASGSTCTTGTDCCSGSCNGSNQCDP